MLERSSATLLVIEDQFLVIKWPLESNQECTDRESNFRGKVPYQDIERRKWRGHQYSICPIRPSENGDLIMAPQNVRLSRSQSDQTDGRTACGRRCGGGRGRNVRSNKRARLEDDTTVEFYIQLR